MQLLIVNDEYITTKMIKEKIDWTSLDITSVFCAYCAAEAQEILKKESIDILLCDIEMPGEDGIELIRWIRKQDLDCECIMLTCHADFRYAQESLKLGVLDYILLPAKYEDIRQSVQQAIDRRKVRRNRQEIYEYGQQWLNSKAEALHQKSGQRHLPKDLVEECISYIQKNLSSVDLSVNQLASQLYLNPIYLNRIFKKEKGIPLIQYIINERMKLAAQLLTQSSLPLNTVAEGVGHSSYSYFVSAFKRYFGCTPSQYRKDQSENNDLSD